MFQRRILDLEKGGAKGIVVPRPLSAVMRSYQSVSRDSRTHNAYDLQ